jgi:threonine synthase
VTESISRAIRQRSLGDPAIDYPLWPVLTTGCPRSSTAAMQYPLEVDYAYDEVAPALFDQPPLPGLDRWAPLLPPLAAVLALGEGGTPLLAAPRLAEWAGFDGELLIKDESRNPTWSHKDRLNLCAVSAAAVSGAPGVVVASSGNHGASAAAYAAAAGLPCVVLSSPAVPLAVQQFLMSYGAAVVGVPSDARWPLMRYVVDELGYMPVSNLTPFHTGHPFGPEGYKTIAYEIFLQLGRRLPEAVFVPTGYAELLYGVWKGFAELLRFGLVAETSRLYACEPAARAPLTRALAEGAPAMSVAPEPTAAYSVAVQVNGYRGVRAVRSSEGMAVAVSDEEMIAAQSALTRQGLWVELSSAISLAGLRQRLAAGERFTGPVVCISTSSGFKDNQTAAASVPVVEPDWPAVRELLATRYGLRG